MAVNHVIGVRFPAREPLEGGQMARHLSLKQEIAGSSPAPPAILRSSKGRTAGFEPANVGSSPTLRTNYCLLFFS